jgi:hypothetical protein
MLLVSTLLTVPAFALQSATGGTGDAKTTVTAAAQPIVVYDFVATNLRANAKPSLSQTQRNQINAKQLDQQSLQQIQQRLKATLQQRSGGSDSGGGSGVVLHNGQVRFADLLTDGEIQQISQSALSASEIRKRFFASDRYVKQLAETDMHFFDCATSVLASQKHNFAAIPLLLNVLGDAEVFKIQFQLPQVSSSSINKLNLDQPLVGTYADRVPEEFQTLLAAYANNQLWINARFISKMSSEDRCALSVHEAFRQLNYSGVLKTNLSQSEIEVATRYFMRKDSHEDSDILEQVVEKLKNPEISIAHLKQLADEKEQEADELLQQLENLGPRPADVRGAAWDKQRQYLQYRISVLTNEASSLSSMVVIKALQQPKLKELAREKFAESAAIQDALLTPLPYGLYWDVLELKIVGRP